MPIIMKGGTYRGGIYRNFIPPLIDNCSGWWDASDASTINLVLGKVSQWDDKSENKNNLTQGVAASQPTYVAAGWNGTSPTVSFDGSNDYITSVFTNSIDIGNMTIFMAVRINAVTSTDYCFAAEGAGTNSPFSLLFSSNITDAKLLWEYGLGVDEVIVPTVQSTADESIYYMNRNIVAKTSDVIFQNTTTTNSEFNIAYTNNSTASGTPLLGLGGTNGALNANCYISEFITYKAILTDHQRDTVINYLKNKWGV